MTGRCRPEVRIEQRMDDGSIAAGTLAEHTSATRAATVEFMLHHRHNFLNEDIRVGANGCAIDVLIAAKAGYAIRERHHYRRHGTGADQAIESFGNVFAEIFPVGVGRAATCLANKVDQQWQALAIVVMRHIDIEQSLGGITEEIVFQ